MSTTPEDADALFDAPAQAPEPVLPTGGPALPEARREVRVKVSWPARVQLPGGQVVELRVRDVSEGGVGLLTETRIPADSVLNFAMGVPALDQPGKVVPVTGSIKTTYLVVQGHDLCCGGLWVTLPADSREFLNKWIRRLRR